MEEWVYCLGSRLRQRVWRFQFGLRQVKSVGGDSGYYAPRWRTWNISLNADKSLKEGMDKLGTSTFRRILYKL